ncbi:MAG TPA: hydroxymethylpyrimidine/phosphomethylpyrimidine kinase [Puia sp.]|nr:hydroxymethylpyrimidine/phosphomethylpyrimidine kinase [Puia sp.]
MIQPITIKQAGAPDLSGDRTRPNVLVIAGYDQSGGAGVLADVKTLEAHGVYGYAVCTGMTFQNERTITKVQWFTEKEIFEQIDLCCQSARFDWVKIGICRSVTMIGSILRHLREHNPAIKIILDPVIRASSGLDFWEGIDRDGFESVAGQTWLLTPNWEEIGWLYPGQDIPGRCQSLSLSASCNLYLKGGHNPHHPGRDYLWSKGEVQVLDAAMEGTVVYPKHGSGCVLASSLTANLALGYPLELAAGRAKQYIHQFLTSNKTLLGWHQSLQDQACIS